jgi:hypothetical protein
MMMLLFPHFWSLLDFDGEQLEDGNSIFITQRYRAGVGFFWPLCFVCWV